ncbi:hypothetical protein OQA88_7251 [Cercophora sp. LCS_1]
MATIEPRLIHLLNNSQTPDLPPIQLPPLDAGATESLSLAPLEPDPGHRGDKPPPLTHIPPLHAVSDDSLAKQSARNIDNSFGSDGHGRGSKAAHPLQLLLGDKEANTSTLSLRMLVDDNTPELLDDPSTKKRHRALTTKDDYPQLPQPLKKQKSTQQVVPPIIAGLHEPPPNAGVFPPITSSDGDSLNMGILKDFGNINDDRAAAALSSAHGSDSGNKNDGTKAKRRAAKPRRKWSDEETNHLLLGVSRHGVGKWTSILEDPAFKFNDRTAGDLKDRFRTCCPDELRGPSASASGKKQRSSGSKGSDSSNGHGNKIDSALEDNLHTHHHTHPKPKTGPLLENLLIDPSESAATTPTASHYPPSDRDHLNPDSDSASVPKQQRKSRAHRKKLEDLVELGIHGPFKKSLRRERRPFTEQDDKEILDGLDTYGPAWTKIQRDRRYHLGSRQPTDLRDRVRNKYPEIYARIEKGVLNVNGAIDGKGAEVLEPSVNTSMEAALKQQGHQHGVGELNRSSSREEILSMPPTKWPGVGAGVPGHESSESLPGLADVIDLSSGLQGHGGQVPGVGTPSEMDISRLLLDDGKKHQKRLSAPSHWLLDKLSGVYAPRPSAGPHKLRDCMPLIVFVRNRLKYALNFRETRAILMQRLVKVDGKVRTDMTYPAGFMDVITIEKTGENFRLIYDTKGRFTVHRIQDEEAKYKLGKVKRVQLGRGGVPFLVTHDARTIRYPDPLVKVNDTVKIDLETGKIQDFIKFDTGAIAMVTGGRNMGRVGVITHRERHDGGFAIVHLKDAIDNTFATREANVFVIGSEKPWVSLPKGKGVKLTIAEERDRRRAQALAH